MSKSPTEMEATSPVNRIDLLLGSNHANKIMRVFAVTKLHS